MKSHPSKKQIPLPSYYNKTTIVFLSLILVLHTGKAFSQEVVVSDHKGTKMTVTNNVVTTNDTAPSNPATADVWFDNTDTANVITKIYDGTSWQSVSSGGSDDMGNHTATENIKLTGHWLSNDGGAEGVFVDTDGDVGVGTSNPSEELEVDGTVDAKAFKSTVYTAERTTSFTTDPSNSWQWKDFPDLSITITLTEAATVIMNYSISMLIENDWLATRLNVGGNVRVKTIAGDFGTNPRQYSNISESWSETLSAGTHTIKVEYRTDDIRTMDPGSNFQQAFLQATVFGNQ